MFLTTQACNYMITQIEMLMSVEDHTLNTNVLHPHLALAGMRFHHYYHYSVEDLKRL